MAESEIEQHRTFAGVIDILEALGIEYVIWGGVAAVAYGEMRFTFDMDIVLRLDTYRARLMAKALEEDHYYVSLPSILDAIGQGGYFNVIHFYTNVKVDFFVPRYDPIIQWGFDHRRMLPFDEMRQAAYMPPEAVVLTKLRTYRDSGSTRHLEDIEGMLRVSGPGPDVAYIEREALKMGMLKVWRELLVKTEASWTDDKAPTS
jgi:hypothetical protein